MTEQAQQTIESVRSKFSDALIEESVAFDDATIVIDASKWLTVAKSLSDSGFSFLSDLTAIDRPALEPRFQIVYSMTDMEAGRRLRVKVGVAGDPPTASSVVSIWPTADWFEREVYDMFGILFEGHPDLRRILMPDEWEGHPLRKDYAVGKVPIEFKNINPGFRVP